LGDLGEEEEEGAYGEEAATKAVELPYELPAEAGDHLRAATLRIDGCTPSSVFFFFFFIIMGIEDG
jgi:hypothetical protein